MLVLTLNETEILIYDFPNTISVTMGDCFSVFFFFFLAFEDTFLPRPWYPGLPQILARGSHPGKHSHAQGPTGEEETVVMLAVTLVSYVVRTGGERYPVLQPQTAACESQECAVSSTLQMFDN